ncbi:DUF2065 domain-containing protein [Thermithiobacillus plumbiphilus]|uniref:DUF2065 domain-containing protein n=1 Tax=Thermithiobacillus plumbiphilus TaxID=1729899 RepID=A0ABU9DDQ8_9PROT
MNLLLKALALMLVLEGIPYFLSPAGAREAMRQLMDALSDRQLRSLGLVSMLAGLLLLYLAG